MQAAFFYTELLNDFMKKIADWSLHPIPISYWIYFVFVLIHRFQFQNLYFHKFLQSREDITAFPVLAVQNLRRLQNVTYKERERKWTQAYKSWVQDHYPEGGIDLETTCSEDIYAWRAFNYRFYRDDPIDEADLVRNLISHFNECRAKDIPASAAFDLKQVGEVVFSLFPDIYTDLFDFLYECNVYLDFTARRTYYRCVPLCSILPVCLRQFSI